MKGLRRAVWVAALGTVWIAAAYAQTTAAAPSGAFDMSGFPLWTRDLRRAEIVAFGSFPFAMFISTTAMDLYRSSTHDWDNRYAPWPLKPAGAVEMTTDEHVTVLLSAAAISVLAAMTDFLIVQIKRGKARRAEAALAPESPIIIRQPWPAPEGEAGTVLPPESP